MPLRLKGYGVFEPTFHKVTACSVRSGRPLTSDQVRQIWGISKFFAKADSKGAVHIRFQKIIRMK